MNILYIEPFYSGAHKQWIDSYKKNSSHNIEILSLPGNKWKWRIHGGAVTLAEKYNNYDQQVDLILCSDFLNLPVFKSLCIDRKKNIPFLMYFHENQLSYPWSPYDPDIFLNRDLHYHYINYTSSLASDFNFFNSQYHLSSYLKSIKKYLKKMPDFNNYDTIELIAKKSDVLYIGCELKKIRKYTNKTLNQIPVILWNHRWEFDKNPELFFNTLFKLKNNNIDFQLIVIGESFKKYPNIFDKAKSILNKEIIQFGYCEKFSEYAYWLDKADVLPVTSNQDFFGISIVEATYMGAYPLLPKRLSYPEIFNQKNNSKYFYDNDSELYIKLENFLKSHVELKKSTLKLKKLVCKFDWENMVKKYDQIFEQFKN